MRNLASSLISLGLVLVAGCPGSAPSGGGDDTLEPDAAPDAPPVDPGQRLSGKTMDYFTANTPMDAVTLSSDGIEPQMISVSAVGGEYELLGVPTGSKVYFTATRPLYRPTRNAPVTIEGMPVVQDLYLMTLADIARQYATANVPLVAGKTFLAAELKRNNGMPLDGILLTAITLVDTLDQPVLGTSGPFVFGAAGDIDPVLTTATIFNGKSRIAFLDVPPGMHTLKIVYLDAQLVEQTMTVPVAATADGATIAISGQNGGGGGGGGMITNPKCGMHIYPRLQKASAGGLGCANCHTAGGTAGAVLVFDNTPDVVLNNMNLRPGVIDLITPADSMFLTKPLYEPPPANHPNATFIDVNDVDYKMFLLWITQGALL